MQTNLFSISLPTWDATMMKFERRKIKSAWKFTYREFSVMKWAFSFWSCTQNANAIQREYFFEKNRNKWQKREIVDYFEKFNNKWKFSHWITFCRRETIKVADHANNVHTHGKMKLAHGSSQNYRVHFREIKNPKFFWCMCFWVASPSSPSS